MFKDKKILVCGMAKSGISAAYLLNKLGAKVTVCDKKPKEEVSEYNNFLSLGIDTFFGEDPDSIVDKFDIIVLSPGIPCDLKFIEKANSQGIEVIGEIELGYRLSKGIIIGITGTNGKTTTTTLVGEIFNRVGKSAVVGNIGNPYTKEVLDLGEKDYTVMELSSFQLETIKEFKPNIATVLNITPDHLNRHKTLENYIKAKENIFLNQTKKDYLILNFEDSICRDMEKRANSRVYFFSSKHILKEGIFISNGSIYANMEGINEELIPLTEIKILGTHNYENIMAAAGISICGGVPLNITREAIRGFNGVEHRIEYCGTKNGVDYYNDSKGTNPDASIKAVYAMVKPIILIGGGYDKNADYSEWVRTFKGRVRSIVLIGETAEKIKECCIREGFNDIILCKGFKEAVLECRNIAKDGDCVLLSPACASWGMFDNYEQRGNIFKSIVNEL